MGQFTFSAARARAGERPASDTAAIVVVRRKIRRFINGLFARSRRGGVVTLPHTAEAVDVVAETDVGLAGVFVVTIAGAAVVGAETPGAASQHFVFTFAR